jgi:hypothetical protein
MRFTIASSLVLAAVAVLASCSDGSSEVTVENQSVVSGQTGATSGVQTVALLLPSSQRSIPHSGTREVASYEWTGSTSHLVRYREEVWINGGGQYATSPLEAIEGVEPDWLTFRLIQLGRQGQIYKFRDFLIRDAALFAQNWSLTDRLQTKVVAGQTCARYRVERTVGTAHAFELWVDVNTNLLLRYEEEDDQQRPLSSMSFESIDYTPDFSGVAWHSPEERPAIDFTHDLKAQLGFKPIFPSLLPTGYAFHSAEIADGGDSRWVSAKYLDGVEPLLFLERFRLSEIEIGHAGTSSGPHYVGGGMNQVYVFHIGAATALQGTLNGHDIVVVGQVAQDELLDMVESSIN